jgi:salicylate hydroxylase
MAQHKARHILVVGAGIGGLTAALTLARAGIDVTVIERAQTLSEVGAGIQLSPNASRILVNLGLGGALHDAAVYPDAIRIFSTRSGGEVATLPLGAHFAARYGAPYLVIHRADLQTALLAACSTRGTIDVRLGIGITAIHDTGGSIELVTDTGERLAGDALIGADGVRSAIRTDVLAGPPAAPSGRIAFRATIPIALAPDAYRQVTCVWMAPHAHLVHYPIAGGRLLNLVAVAEGEMPAGTWSEPAQRDEALAAIRGGTSWPRSADDLLAKPDAWTKWALCDVDPRFAWTKGRITLLGDAAHAMLPFAAQGGAMAIEDAEVLASALATDLDIAEALTAYEAARKPRVTAVVDLAASNGRIYHLANLPAVLRDTALRALPARFALQRQDWIYAWRAA